MDVFTNFLSFFLENSEIWSLGKGDNQNVELNKKPYYLSKNMLSCFFKLSY